MKSAPRKRGFFFLLSGAALGAVFFALPVDAQVVEQPVYSSPVKTPAHSAIFRFGTTTVPTTIQALGLWMSDPNQATPQGSGYQIRLTCFANTYSDSQAGCTDTSGHTSDGPVIAVYSTFGQEYNFSFSSPVVLQSGRSYLVDFVQVGSPSATTVLYGTNTYQFNKQCDFGGVTYCSGTPYFVFDAIPNWTGINATSTALTSLYQSGASSTLALIEARCSGAGNVFSQALCAAGAFLFIPDPAVLNGFASLPTLVDTKFPFSWWNGMTETVNGLTASSSANMAVVTLGLSAVDPATSTIFGQLLPNVTVLSSTTITRYLSPSILATLLIIEALALWVIVGFFIFDRVRHKWLHL